MEGVETLGDRKHETPELPRRHLPLHRQRQRQERRAVFERQPGEPPASRRIRLDRRDAKSERRTGAVHGGALGVMNRGVEPRTQIRETGLGQIAAQFEAAAGIDLGGRQHRHQMTVEDVLARLLARRAKRRVEDNDHGAEEQQQEQADRYQQARIERVHQGSSGARIKGL